MPKDLFAAFRATFEEATEADLILEVVDASDPEQQEHLDTTAQILSGLDLDRTARLRVYNKIDRVPAEEIAGFEAEPNSVCISALQRETTTHLLDRVSEELAKVLSAKARSARSRAIRGVRRERAELVSSPLNADRHSAPRAFAAALARRALNAARAKPPRAADGLDVAARTARLERLHVRADLAARPAPSRECGRREHSTATSCRAGVSRDASAGRAPRG